MFFSLFERLIKHEVSPTEMEQLQQYLLERIYPQNTKEDNIKAQA